MPKLATIAVSFACLAVLAGCNSVGTASPSPVTPPVITTPQNPTVSISPNSNWMVLGSSQQFTATVTNGDSAVTWQVDGIPGGSDVVGTISTSGVYTAPAILPSEPVVEIEASAANGHGVASASAVLVSPSNIHYLYVSSATDDNISGFSVDEYDGLPNPIGTVLVGSGKGPAGLAMHPTGKFLYSLNRGSNDVSVFAVNPATGDLSPAGTAPAPDGPYAMVFSPRGDFAYLSCDNASAIAVYAVDSGTGALTPVQGSPYLMGSKLQGLSIPPNGRFLYVTDPGRNKIIGLAINPSDGTLTAIPGSPFTGSPGVASIVARWDTAFTGNRDNNTFGIYGIDEASGWLTAQTQIPSGGISPELIPGTSIGFLLGVNTGSNTLFSLELGDSQPSTVITGTMPAPGRTLLNRFNYPWAYVVNKNTEGLNGSIGVYRVTYEGASDPITTVPTGSINPTGFAITP